MNVRAGRWMVLGAVSFVCLSAQAARAQFTAPTKEELAMTAEPKAPGADAVLLLREEDTESKLYSWTTHVRVKVLTEAGKRYGHVVVGQSRWLVDPGQWQQVRGYRVTGIEARTIHPDGTVVRFTGEAALKEGPASAGARRDELSFDLPEVTVGSILEYSYTLVNSDNIVFAPHWEVQSELYTRKEHFLWRPMRSDGRQVSVGDKKGRQVAESIGWLQILPKNAQFTHAQISGTGAMAGEYGQMIMELKVEDVPPTPKEPFMPPVANTRYRVQFYYTPALSTEQYWKDEGRRVLGVEDEFMTPGPKIQAAVTKLVSPGDTEEQRLRKLYAAVAKVENLTYTRGFTVAGDAGHGIATPKSAEEVWERQAAHSDPITELFISMARAAGLKAYLMDVANRRRNLFDPGYLTFAQLGDYIAIVRVNGTEQFFDPDVPMTPYGQLAWEHAGSAGVRQTDAGRLAEAMFEGATPLHGAEPATTPAASYKDSHTLRVAELTMDERGVATGEVKLTWTGARAQELRELSLRGDNGALQRELRAEAARQLPTGTTVEIEGIAGIDDGEKPLEVSYTVKGRIGAVRDGRVELAGSLFEAGTKERFPASERQTPVYFGYPYQVSDAVRITLPKGMTVESAPAAAKLTYQRSAAYSFSVEQEPGSLVLRRDLVVGNVSFPVTEYGELRGFFESVEKTDRETAMVGGAR